MLEVNTKINCISISGKEKLVRDEVAFEIQTPSEFTRGGRGTHISLLTLGPSMVDKFIFACSASTRHREEHGT